MPDSGLEFTGERVIPGQVEPDLWNEHFARYLFAGRLSRNKRVIDLACGAGYGSAELSRTAARVVGIDCSPAAIGHAREHYQRDNVAFLLASVTAVPLASASFDLVVAFEVVEHLREWSALLAEARRLLAAGGQFVVSTPNRDYYADSRKLAGANPFHEHEFNFAEFRAALSEFFPHVSFFLQNHSSGVVFQPLQGNSAEVRIENAAPQPESAHFYLAVCALAPQTGSPAFVYVPSTANVLREREKHISFLEQELEQKGAWLAESQKEHQALVGLFRDQQAELEARNRWARKLNEELDAAGARVTQLQDELAAEQTSARETAAAYEAKVAGLEVECAARTQWAQDTESRLTAELESRGKELTECVRLLDQAESTIEERTKWAQSLQRDVESLQAQLSMVRASRWVRVGRKIGLGPSLSGQE